MHGSDHGGLGEVEQVVDIGNKDSHKRVLLAIDLVDNHPHFGINNGRLENKPAIGPKYIGL